jgi:hypothetical protein
LSLWKSDRYSVRITTHEITVFLSALDECSSSKGIHGVNFTRLAAPVTGFGLFKNAEDVSIDRQAVEILEKLLVYIASRVLCVVRNFSMD